MVDWQAGPVYPICLSAKNTVSWDPTVPSILGQMIAQVLKDTLRLPNICLSEFSDITCHQVAKCHPQLMIGSTQWQGSISSHCLLTVLLFWLSLASLVFPFHLPGCMGSYSLCCVQLLLYYRVSSRQY